MHKNPGKSLGFVIVAALFVVAVVFVAFWSTMTQSQRQGITMPEETTVETEVVDTVEPEELFLTVEPENVQQILSTMARPEVYSQTFAVTSYWEDGSGESTVTIWRNGNLRKAEVVTDVSTRHLLTDGETLWMWYGTDEQAAEFRCDETVSLDDLVGIPTYELLTQLPLDAIVAGQFISTETDWTANSLFITASQWEGGETQFWVDATTQILLATQVSQDGVVQQTVQQTNVTYGQVEDAVFTTPKGLILETETQQP